MSQLMSPQSLEELAHVFRSATADNRPVYVYRKSDKPGGENNESQVDLSKLNKIVELDAANLVATVEAGVSLGSLAAELTKAGLRFIPADTPFYHEKTVGQLFYEGCANISGLKYGSAKHFLMGSQVVLPTGDVLKTGGKTVKNVTGYDFTRFFNSPYTDFGITAEFLLKLLPLPETRKDITAAFKEKERILDFAADLKNSQITPAYLLWLDPNVQSMFAGGNKPPQNHVVIMQFDGLTEEASEQHQTALALLEKRGGTVSQPAQQRFPAEKWRALYNGSLEGGYVLTDEIKIAFNRQKDFLIAFYQIAQKAGLKAGLFGQIAEGKLNAAFLTADAAQEARFVDEIIAAAVAAGGVSSGKYDYLTGRRKKDKLAELEQKAKLAFDPKLILNRNCNSIGGEISEQ